MKQKKKQKIIYRLLLGGTLIIALLGILLPGYLLRLQKESELDHVAAAPAEYYSPARSAMARNASAQLGVYQKLQLITGEWESERAEPASYEPELEDYEAAAYARDGLQKLYDLSLYPDNLSAEYGNWYNWDAEAHKAVDSIFHTYTAYYWEIHFRKYDGSKQHTVFLLEDGTILIAYANLSDSYDLENVRYIQEVQEEIEEAFLPIEDLEDVEDRQTGGTELAEQSVYTEILDRMAYTGLDMGRMELRSYAHFANEEESYYILQEYSDREYFFAVTL